MNFILRLVQMGINMGAGHFAKALVESPAFHQLVRHTNRYLALPSPSFIVLSVVVEHLGYPETVLWLEK